MELTINNKEYRFIFGFEFIQELNRRYSVKENGILFKAGLDNVLANFFNEDIETLVEMLKVANQTESPKVSQKELISLVSETGSEKLFDQILEELKKSEFTKGKTRKILTNMEKA